MTVLPKNVDETSDLLRKGNYLANRSLSTALYLSMSLGKPLFLEGEAGVGKTEIAKVLSDVLDRELLRLQCYEGLDITTAVYEWNYARQMIAIRMSETTNNKDHKKIETDIFDDNLCSTNAKMQV